MNKAKVHIETEHLSYYIKFFSDVVQTELNILEDGVVLILGHLEIVIKEKKSADTYPLHIEFLVPDMDDFKSRLDFFIFRNANIKLSVNQINKVVQVIEFEGRKWTFSN